MALSKAADVAGTVSNLSVYFGQQAALENINMQIHRRRINVLSGPSGSGKTTLLRALNRLNDEYQHSRTRGEITLCVADKPLSVNQLKTTELPYLRRKVGMVFQHPQLLPGSVAQNLLLPLKVVGNLQGEAALKQMQQAFEQAALWDEVKDRLSAPALTLSGGQQQRLCLARTLVFEPDILLLDEPTSSLDPEATAQIEALIKRLAGHCTLVMVSHCEHQTARLADHLYRFEYGRLRPESA
jgi:phosphate transport system ATP-binding protein